ncbi:hypothetical protein QA641_23705 [Bradyrhizobium sp. CB1650]|uniref:hypothetical protein n=1 Tax=Bradyrhizobium sp. CB1650 TaxID=3039153 RepID=UPI002434DD8C|nr:hypothetical protein [Bradyrhizobium sp. CB1650]WGD48658.1 hypothetical protein QA641_23705 [Bradyrhizobium sp. CB1650]
MAAVASRLVAGFDARLPPEISGPPDAASDDIATYQKASPPAMTITDAIRPAISLGLNASNVSALAILVAGCAGAAPSTVFLRLSVGFQNGLGRDQIRLSSRSNET